MKIYFYIGPNKQLKSGFSIEFWKIGRKGRTVIVKWGPAMVDIKQRKVLKASWTQVGFPRAGIGYSILPPKLDFRRKHSGAELQGCSRGRACHFRQWHW